MTLTDALIDFAAAPPGGGPARAMARLALLDWAACGIAGGGEPVARLLRDKALSEGGAGQAALIGGGRAPAAAAALVNGATSHALDYDDTHFAHIGHPSVAVMPAALAMAERTSRGLDECLDAALVGAEASIRVGVWLGRGHYQAGFHQTATAGAFGATLAAGRLLRLDAAGMRHALGLAATRASGLKSQFGTMGKPLNAGLAAETGVQAALWAAAGMTSAEDGLAGPQGFGPTHHGAADETALDGLGERWLFETVSQKFHACCHGLHAMLEALGTVEAAPQDVVCVEVGTHPRWRTVCDQPAPETGLGVKFSFRHAAAMKIAGVDTAAIASFSDATARDPRLRALRERVVVRSDPALAETASRVRVTLAGGRIREAVHDLDAPMPMEERAARLRAKADSLLGAARARALAAAIDAADLAALVSLLEGRRPAAEGRARPA